MKIQKKKIFFFFLGGGGRGGGGGFWGGGGGGQDGCDRRIEVFRKIKKKFFFEILHLQNCDVKFQDFQRAITQKISYEFFFKFHHII